MASVKVDDLTKESGEMSVEETKLIPTDQDTISTPPTEPETTQAKEIPVSDEEKEKEKQLSEDEEEEKPAESWPIIEEAAPDHASFDAASGGTTTHEFGEEEDEDEDDD